MSNSNEYTEARMKFLALRAEYESKLAELEPLRVKVLEAERAADEAWKLILCR